VFKQEETHKNKKRKAQMFFNNQMGFSVCYSMGLIFAIKLLLFYSTGLRKAIFFSFMRTKMIPNMPNTCNNIKLLIKNILNISVNTSKMESGN